MDGLGLWLLLSERGLKWLIQPQSPGNKHSGSQNTLKYYADNDLSVQRHFFHCTAQETELELGMMAYTCDPRVGKLK